MIRAPAISVFIAECFLNRAAENSRLLIRFISDTRSVMPVKAMFATSIAQQNEVSKNDGIEGSDGLRRLLEWRKR